MANDEQIGPIAHAEHDEPVFLFGMGLVKKLDSEFIVKDGFCLGKGNAMFLEIGGCLVGIPFELHLYIVWMTAGAINPVAGRNASEAPAESPLRRAGQVQSEFTATAQNSGTSE
jgi:hypothetical protein